MRMRLIALILLISITSCATVNQKAVKRTIKPGSSIGVLINPMNTTDSFQVMRKFITAGYTVKALKTIEACTLYPGLRDLYTRGVKVDGNIEKLNDMAKMSDIQMEVTLKNELTDVKKEIGIDYLFYLYNDGNTYNATAIDLATYEIVFSHTVGHKYITGVNWVYNQFNGPNADLDYAMELFINAMQGREPVQAAETVQAAEQQPQKRDLRLQ